MQRKQDLCTSGVIAGGAVAKGNGSVTEEIPGGVGRRRAGEGVGRNTANSEEGVLVTSEHRSEELLDVVDMHVCCGIWSKLEFHGRWGHLHGQVG